MDCGAAKKSRAAGKGGAVEEDAAGSAVDPWLSLPPELIILIATFLDNASALAVTSKRMRSILRGFDLKPMYCAHVDCADNLTYTTGLMGAYVAGCYEVTCHPITHGVWRRRHELADAQYVRSEEFPYLVGATGDTRVIDFWVKKHGTKHPDFDQIARGLALGNHADLIKRYSDLGVQFGPDSVAAAASAVSVKALVVMAQIVTGTEPAAGKPPPTELTKKEIELVDEIVRECAYSRTWTMDRLALWIGICCVSPRTSFVPVSMNAFSHSWSVWDQACELMAAGYTLSNQESYAMILTQAPFSDVIYGICLGAVAPVQAALMEMCNLPEPTWDRIYALICTRKFKLDTALAAAAAGGCFVNFLTLVRAGCPYDRDECLRVGCERVRRFIMSQP